MLNHKHKTLLLNIIASPFFLAIPVTLLIIIFLPNPSSKYKIELVSKQIANKPESNVQFCDLNGNGKDERIIAYHNTVKKTASIKVMTHDEINYDAWNFNGYFQGQSSVNFYCTDINEDGFTEIFAFYYRSDSVFMTVIQPYPDKKIIFKEKLITTVWKRNGKIDYSISNYNTEDLNRDGNKELLFLLQAGYSLQPRMIVAYDFAKNSISTSKSYGAYLTTLTLIKNKQSIPELYVGSFTPANISDSMGIPYSDYYSWFLGFDSKLELLFNPVKNVYYPSRVDVCKFENDEGEQFIAASFINNIKKLLTIKFIKQGNEVISFKEFVKSKKSKSGFVSLMRPVQTDGKNYILLGIKNNQFILINEKLEIVKKDVYKAVYALMNIADLNKDGKKEFVFMSPDNEIVVYDNNLNNPTSFNTGLLPFSSGWLNSGIKHNGNEQNELYLKNLHHLYLFTYNLNRLYYLKYPIWLLLYGLAVLILWFAQRMQKINLKRKQLIEDTINNLQMRTIKSQMDPHFMFNVLNGLAHNVAVGNSKDAYNQILRFSKLLRSLMKKTDRIDTSLSEEIEFITSYLELEKFRFKDQFEFDIHFDDQIDKTIRLPRMLIQLLVENSIKHGLRNKTGIKKLKVSVSLNNNQLTIIVEDNGVGREEAMQKTHDTGKGMKLIKDMIRLNRKLGGKQITLNYTDLYDDSGNAAGTRVEVIVESETSKPRRR